MAKNVKNKSKKVRSFKVHTDAYGIPFVRFGGKYLPKELDISEGDRLEMTRVNDIIMLRKCSAQEVADYEKARQAKEALAVLKKLFPDKQKAAAMMIAENRTNDYTIEEELANNSEKYSQA